MPEHEALVKYMSNKYYGGKRVDEIGKKLLSDRNAFDTAMDDIWKTNYSQTPKEEFVNKYLTKYGDPFKKKSTSSIIGEDLSPGLPANIPPLQEGVAEAQDFTSPEMAAADQRESTAPPVITPEEQGRTSSALGAINQRFYGLPGEVMKAVAIGGSKIGGLIEGQELDATENPLYKAGQWYQDKIAEIAPNNKKYQGELQESVATAIGDLAGLVVGGGIARTAGKASQLALLAEKYGMPVSEAATQLAKGLISPEGIIGATQMGVSEYEQAKSSGATEEQATDQFFKNAAVGSVLERIPVQLFWKRLDTVTGGGVKNMLKTGFSGGIEEGTTEIMQQAYSNITARESYDKTRKIIDGMGEAGGIGFGLGFVLNAMGVRLRKIKETATGEDIKAVDKAIAYVEQKQSELGEAVSDQPSEQVTNQQNEIQRSNEELTGTDTQLLGGPDTATATPEVGDSGVSQNQSDVVDDVPTGDRPTEASELGERFTSIGGNKIVDTDGNPITVYHGTLRGGFNEFSPESSVKSSSRAGIFFTDNKKVSQAYSDSGADIKKDEKYFDKEEELDKLNSQYANKEEFKDENPSDGLNIAYYNFSDNRSDDFKRKLGYDSIKKITGSKKLADEYIAKRGELTEKENNVIPGIYSSNISIKNPLVVDFNGNEWNRGIFEGKGVTTNDLTIIAMKRGHDGVVIKNVIDVGKHGNVKFKNNKEKVSNVYVVFDKSQIKSRPSSALGETVAPNENMPEQETQQESEPPALTDAIYQAQGLTKVKLSDITYTDDNGNPCAKMGGRGGVFTKGSQWEIVADMTGYPSHKNGGVDIKFDKSGISFVNAKGNPVKAANGLILKSKAAPKKEVKKPILKMTFATSAELVDTDDPVRNKVIQDGIKEKFEILKSIIKELW